MKAEELRIGNYVKAGIEIKGSLEASINLVDSERTTEITLKHFQVFQNFPMLIELCKPIELTEDWLINFGFDACEGVNERLATLRINNPDVYGHPTTALIRVHFGGKNSNDNFGFFYNGSGEHGGNWIKYIKHVHQLQNLYFALTGQELALK